MRFPCSVGVGILVMLGAITCTRSDEQQTVAPATTTAPRMAQPAASPAIGEVEEGDEILMVWAEAEPDEGAPPLTVQLKADISGGSGERKVKWDFGDGSAASSEVNPVHKYEKAGTYRASVEVSDSTGDSDSDYVDIEVGAE